MKEKECPPRPFLTALLYERDGDLNLTWLFVLIMGIVGAIGFFVEVVIRGGDVSSTPAKMAAWSFLAGAFLSVLIAAIPIAKAKILANAKLPGEVSKSIASIRNVETSTDIQEIYQKLGTTEDPDIG